VRVAAVVRTGDPTTIGQWRLLVELPWMKYETLIYDDMCLPNPQTAKRSVLSDILESLSGEISFVTSAVYVKSSLV
jgi:hypothetical protein